LFVKDFFGLVPVVLSISVLLLCIIGLFIKNVSYRVSTSIILFLYSIVFCIMLIVLYLFFPPYGSKQVCTFFILLLITLFNFILSVLMLRKARREIKEDT
jgi:hypothetical protein